MPLKLQLVKNGEIIFEIPLAAKNWPKEELQEELDKFEEDFDDVSSFFDALSNEARLRMMKRLLEEDDLSMGFGEFMKDLSLNPKIVWESTRKLTKCGLIEKSNGGQYRCSSHGQAEFLMVSLALKRLLRALHEFEEW